MSKLKIAILFGGRSGEHEVSIASATSVFQALDKEKYEITLVGIDKQGRWLLPNLKDLLAQTNPRQFKFNADSATVHPLPFPSEESLVSLDGTKNKARFDVIIPILHGTYGEDGTMQGLLELTQTAYVGSGVLGSAVGMDKDVSKRLLKAAGVPVVPSMTLSKLTFNANSSSIINDCIKKLGLPLFVKPCNAGSSLGVHKIKTKDNALEKILEAFKYDNKVLIETSIDARELECAVLGHHRPKASLIGEVIPKNEFYTYEAKYLEDDGAELKIPTQLPKDIELKLQEYSLQAFKCLELSGMARIDFFLDKNTEEVYLNEVNTIPGFTEISQYPKLWVASGLAYPKLLDQLIELALEKHKEKTSLKTEF